MPIFHVEKLAELKVQITDHLKSQFPEDEGAGLIRMFSEWKNMGPHGEYEHYYFGKDGLYNRPLVNGVPVLRHVHILPDENSRYMPAWEKAWERRGRKKSDDVLIYTEGNVRLGYLLIAIVLEPNGHDFAEMKTPEDKAMMEGFASAADHFQFDGSIIV